MTMAHHRPMLVPPAPTSADVRDLADQLRRVASTLERHADRIAAGSAAPERIPAAVSRLSRATTVASSWRCEGDRWCGLTRGHEGPHQRWDPSCEVGP